MVERLVHTEEVTGSMPVSPTREGFGPDTIRPDGVIRFHLVTSMNAMMEDPVHRMR